MQSIRGTGIGQFISLEEDEAELKVDSHTFTQMERFLPEFSGYKMRVGGDQFVYLLNVRLFLDEETERTLAARAKILRSQFDGICLRDGTDTDALFGAIIHFDWEFLHGLRVTAVHFESAWGYFKKRELVFLKRLVVLFN